MPSDFRDEKIVPFYIEGSQGPHRATSADVTLEMSFKHHGRSLALLAAPIQTKQEVTPTPLLAYFFSLLKSGQFVVSFLNTGNENCMVICRDALIRSTTMKKCFASPGETCCDEAECVVLGL